MKKLVVVSGGLVAVGSAALVGAGIAMSQPSGSLNVVGEPYNKALAILKASGYKGTFGGSVGSVLSQSSCLVDTQKMTSEGKILLMLDCTQHAADMLAAMGPAAGPRVGSNGVTTVTPTPMVPIAGAPGAGSAPGAQVPGVPRAPGAPPPVISTG
ncbi:hypothetical protein [Mycobacterium neglectum]|uniref:hypothetical protein n=1 Tax=Mycobacterium neglectum TaxID=242737 RepID=UPI000BFEC646|nr:hypothetical protein [Mycobacterium neglectum]